MNSDDLKRTSKKYQATITSYLLALMFIAGKNATDKLNGEISIQVPVNMRKYYPSKTLRNFSMYCECVNPCSFFKWVFKYPDLLSISFVSHPQTLQE